MSSVRVGTSGWSYLRFRELVYSEGELETIAAELNALAKGDTDALAHFRHGEAPDAPAAAARIASGFRSG